MYEFKDKCNRYGENHRTMHINMQDMHAVIQMLHNLTDRTLWLFVDNKVCMYSLFESWSGSLALREYVYEASALLIKYHIRLLIDYVTTDCNTPPDLLSRLACMKDKEERERLFMEKAGGKLLNLVMIDEADVDYYESLRLFHIPVDLPDWPQYLDGSGRPIVADLFKILKH